MQHIVPIQTCQLKGIWSKKTYPCVAKLLRISMLIVLSWSLEHPDVIIQNSILFLCHPFHGEFGKIYRSGEYGSTAYVTFKERYALETAVLLSVSFFPS